MKLLLLIIRLLPLFITCSSHGLSCNIDTGSICLDGDVTGAHYGKFDCTEASNFKDFAITANSKGSWIIPVEKGGDLDNNLPGFMASSSLEEDLTYYNVADDGRLHISAKDVLRNVASACNTQTDTQTDPNLESVFRKCPYKDTQQFDNDIRNLHNCLNAYQPRGRMNVQDKAGHYEYDESDVDNSQFSNFPDFTYTNPSSASTVTSKTRTVSISLAVATGMPSGYAQIVESGTPTHFGVQETSQPSSGTNTGNAGAGFKNANHALFGSILACVGILYNMA
ncbi:hypothetical protein Micbo1qcDRAFT_218391 [Microdochium bolleyi]|uniref:Uncharacterized protein n=1 Tax=Microdochium bolleyi TaxID=196109 RepID=A0A136IQZ1_9PEZI|nr:hypothetical protein Micbo1qcDRAFT_218391 [Microdochium bolleyi]